MRPRICQERMEVGMNGMDGSRITSCYCYKCCVDMKEGRNEEGLTVSSVLLVLYKIMISYVNDQHPLHTPT